MRVRVLVIFIWLTQDIEFSFSQVAYRVDWNEKSASLPQSTVFSSRQLALKFADSLDVHFREMGFLQLEREQVLNSDTLVIKLKPGRRFFWNMVSRGSVPQEWWNDLGPPGKEFLDPYQWMQRLVGKLENQGYPFASVSLDSISAEGQELTGVYRFSPGPLISWDSLTLVGSSRTKKEYLQLYSGLVPGSPFSQNEYESSLRKIAKSPYFKLDSVPQVSFRIKSASPVFSLTDRKINVFDGVVGLIPNQNQPNSMLVTGEVNLELYHLGGKGRDFTMHWQRPNIQSQNLKLTARESFLFKSPLGFQVDFSLLKQDSTFVNRTFQVEFGYAVSEFGRLRFFSRRQAGDLIGGIQMELEPPSLLDFRWNNYGLGTKWDWQDDPIFPRRGAKIEGEFALGNKTLIQNTALPQEIYQNFDKSTTQLEGIFEIQKHLYIQPAWGMWLRLKSGVLKNENLFLNEFTRLGGLKSIRGFNEMFFYADRYAFLNFEQRLFFGRGSYLMAFGDLGVIRNPYIVPKVDRPRSFGFGINLDTDGGLFSFVFGIGKSADQPATLSYARIHFGYLARF